MTGRDTLGTRAGFLRADNSRAALGCWGADADKRMSRLRGYGLRSAAPRKSELRFQPEQKKVMGDADPLADPIARRP